MKGSASWTLALGLCSQLSFAQSLSPQDFAFGQPVLTSQKAAAYRFMVPLAIYQETVKADLGDLRLFNAAGVAVPYSLFQHAAPTPIHRPAIALPVFPLREGSSLVLEGIHVTIDAPQSAIHVQTRDRGATDSSAVQYILDARAMNTAVSALRIGWPESAAEYSGHVSIEVSDDLDSWRTVVAAAPIVNLHANAETLTENRVTVTPTLAKYWRIKWLGAAPAFGLTSVQAEPADVMPAPKRMTLEIVGTPDPANRNTYWFDLGAHAPVTAVNVLLPDANSIASVELSSRRADRDPWRPITRARLYRLKTADAEQSNAFLEIEPDTDRYWRAQLTSMPSPPQAPLRLAVAWLPDEVTFLAQGPGPFELAYGSAMVTTAESNFSQIPADLPISAASLGPRHELGGRDRLIANRPPVPATRIVLWSVLILAVFLLAWMAYRLVKEPDTDGGKPTGT